MEGNQQGWAFSGDQHAAQALHDALDAQQELLEAALARAGEAEQRAAAAEQRAAAAAAAEAAQRRAVAAAEQRAADAEARAVAAEHRAAAAEEHAIKAEAQTATARRQRNEASVRLEGLLQSMAALASQYKEGPSMPPSQQQQQQQQHRQPAHPPPPPYPPAAAPWLLHSPHTPPPVQHDWEQRPAPAGTSREWGGSRTLSVRNLPVLTMDTDRGARNKLRAEFERFGAVESMRFGRNRVNASQGWAFVNYADASSAAAARPAMNGQVVPWLGSTPLLVNFAATFESRHRIGSSSSGALVATPSPEHGAAQQLALQRSRSSGYPTPAPPPPQHLLQAQQRSSSSSSGAAVPPAAESGSACSAQAAADDSWQTLL